MADKWVKHKVKWHSLSSVSQSGCEWTSVQIEATQTRVETYCCFVSIDGGDSRHVSAQSSERGEQHAVGGKMLKGEDCGGVCELDEDGKMRNPLNSPSLSFSCLAACSGTTQVGEKKKKKKNRTRFGRIRLWVWLSNDANMQIPLLSEECPRRRLSHGGTTPLQMIYL